MTAIEKAGFRFREESVPCFRCKERTTDPSYVNGLPHCRACEPVDIGRRYT